MDFVADKTIICVGRQEWLEFGGEWAQVAGPSEGQLVRIKTLVRRDVVILGVYAPRSEAPACTRSRPQGYIRAVPDKYGNSLPPASFS
jgi:hypothetical protein